MLVSMCSGSSETVALKSTGAIIDRSKTGEVSTGGRSPALAVGQGIAFFGGNLEDILPLIGPQSDASLLVRLRLGIADLTDGSHTRHKVDNAAYFLGTGMTAVQLGLLPGPNGSSQDCLRVFGGVPNPDSGVVMTTDGCVRGGDHWLIVALSMAFGSARNTWNQRLRVYAQNGTEIGCASGAIKDINEVAREGTWLFGSDKLISFEVAEILFSNQFLTSDQMQRLAREMMRKTDSLGCIAVPSGPPPGPTLSTCDDDDSLPNANGNMSSSTVRMTESTSTGVAVNSPDSGPPTVIIAASAAGAFLVCLLCVGALLVMSKRRKQGSGDALNPPASDRYASVSAVQMAATSATGKCCRKTRTTRLWRISLPARPTRRTARALLPRSTELCRDS